MKIYNTPASTKLDSLRYCTTALAFVLFLIHYVEPSLFRALTFTSNENSTFAFVRYSETANLLCLTGLLGSALRHTRLLTAFSTFVLVDTIVSATIRSFYIIYLFNIRHRLCLYFTTNNIIDDHPIGQCIAVVDSITVIAMLAIVATSVIQFVLGLSVRRFVIFLNMNMHMNEDGEKSINIVVGHSERAGVDEKRAYNDEEEEDVWWDAEDRI